VSAWTEAESAQNEASSAQEQVASQAQEVQQRRLEPGQVIHEQDKPRSHAAEAVSRADVLGGQLAEATERPVEVFARAGTLAETLAMMAQARCWHPPSRWRSFRPCRHPRPGQIPPKVGTTPRVLLLPLSMSEPAGTVCL
jgi:glutamate/tyrosine decarboxylase-like PLP-dependent enzyme